MMNSAKKILYQVFFFLNGIFIVSNVLGQPNKEEKSFEVRCIVFGRSVYDQNKIIQLNDARVEIYQGDNIVGEPIQTIITKSNGKAYFKTTFGKTLCLKITKKGYISTKILIDLRSVNENETVVVTKFNVDLYEKVSGLDFSSFEDYAFKLKPNSRTGLFEFEIDSIQSSNVVEYIVKKLLEREKKQAELLEKSRQFEIKERELLISKLESEKYRDESEKKVRTNEILLLKSKLLIDSLETQKTKLSIKELKQEKEMSEFEKLKKEEDIKRLNKENEINNLLSKNQHIEIKFLEKEKTLNQGELLLQKKQLKQEKNTRIIITFFLISLAIISVLSYLNYRKKKLAYNIIQQKNIEIENQKVKLLEKNKEVLDSIKYAQRIQSAILPPKKLVQKYFENSFILYDPKDIVAGDFYWMETIEEKIFFAVADCTGHGVPGAMVSVMCSNALTKCLKDLGIIEPAKILDKTVEILESQFENSEENLNDGMDISLCSLDLKRKELEFSGAYNSLYLVRSLSLIEIKADMQPIGRFDGRKPFTNHLIKLDKNDIIYLFSDGYSDQFGGPNGKKFMSKNFKKLLSSISNKPMEEQLLLLKEEFENWKGELEQIDDVCVVGIKI